MEAKILTDEQIAEKVREKDQEMYGELISRYEKKLSRYLRKFIHDPDELEDVLQAAFIKAFRNLNSFDAKRKFSSWIYRIAHNEAVNHIRKYSGKKVPIDEVEYGLVDEKTGPDGLADERVLKETLESALGRIKPKYRMALVLFFFEQKSYEEISDILRLPKSTVGTLISRGKKSLKKIVEIKRYEKQRPA